MTPITTRIKKLTLVFCKLGWHSYWNYCSDLIPDLRCHRCGKKRNFLKEVLLDD